MLIYVQSSSKNATIRNLSCFRNFPLLLSTTSSTSFQTFRKDARLIELMSLVKWTQQKPWKRLLFYFIMQFVCLFFVCLLVCLFWGYYLMLGLLMHRREMSDDEIPDVGREFDERYHWHSLKPLSDDYDRTKKYFTGKIPPSLLILKVNQQRTVFTVWNHSTFLNYIVNISLFRKTSKRSWAKETVFTS